MRGSALSAGQFLGYDFCKEHFLSRSPSESDRSYYETATEVFRTDGPPLHLLASVAAALGAATCCTPFDVLVIRHQIASVDASTGRKPSITHIIREIVHKEGVRTFYRGWTAMAAKMLVNCCLYMPIYEQFRMQILKKYLR